MAALPHWEGLYPEAEATGLPSFFMLLLSSVWSQLQEKNVVNNTEGRKEGKETGREG